MRLRLWCISVLIGLWGWTDVNPQEVSISGKDPGYSGATIRFSIPGHPFLDIPSYSETITCDDQGAFRLDLDPGQATSILLLAGNYEASMYIEPGTDYEILLPVYQEVSYAERISPFYEPRRIPIKISGDQNEINNRIFSFDSLFVLLNEKVILARRSGKDALADSLISLLESRFTANSGSWFDQHRRYKEGILKLNEGKTGLKVLSRGFLGEVVREDHPAYLELFGTMFKDFLVYYNRTTEGKGIWHNINRTHNLDSLRSIVATHPAVTNDTITDLILLQELPTLFYRGDYHKEAILILLDSLEADPVKQAYASYAGSLKKKLASLVTGYPPPDFHLPDSDGSTWSPGDFKGKYTYLMFCTPDHYGCMMEYPFLDSYVSKHSDYLEVLTIMVAEYPDQVESFMDRNQHLWRALYYGGENGILKDYMIKAFPVAYLLGPDGNLILSPAPLPTDGFEQQLFRIMRSRGDI